jgi:hypothetical protein
MTQFHEGQEVEVLTDPAFPRGTYAWCKAKIVALTPYGNDGTTGHWHVQFPDGSRGAFDADHIRAVVSDAKIAAYIKRIGDQDKRECIE